MSLLRATVRTPASAVLLGPGAVRGTASLRMATRGMAAAGTGAAGRLHRFPAAHVDAARGRALAV
jgi:hypothetical protein